MNQLYFNDFKSATQATLAYLHAHYGFDLWMLTRTNGQDWFILQADDHGYDVEPRTAFKWADSFCSEMIQGNGPRIAPSSEDVPAYKSAPIAQYVPIKSYVGIPLSYSDGSLFGTLCAINPEPMHPDILNAQADIEFIAKLLNGILNVELQVIDKMRRDERLVGLSNLDGLTKAYNWRAWERFLDLEETRCRDYGNKGYLISIDINGLKEINTKQGRDAGDLMLVKTAELLKRALQEIDIIARVGNDEFATLSIDHPIGDVKLLANNISALLNENGIDVSIGYAISNPQKGLRWAWESAEHIRFKEKKLLSLLS